MTPIIALTIVFGIFAVGEIAAHKTKAVLSTTLVAGIILLIGFWTVIPKTLIDDSQIPDLASVLIGILIVSMGTIIDLEELKNQWKTVVICMITVVASVFMIIVLGGFIIGKDMALAGAPIFAGANVAVLIMTAALNAKGLTTMGAFCVIILITQNFIGIPVASAVLRKEAAILVKDSNRMKQLVPITGELDAASKKTTDTVRKKLINLPKALDKPSVHLTKLGMLASLSLFLSELTNGKIHYLVVCLLIGVIFTELGFLERNSLNKSQSGSIIIILTTAIIFGNLTQASPLDIMNMIFPLIIVMSIGIITTIVAGLIVGRIIKVSPYLCIALGLTCTFGFPTTMFIPTEVAEAFGKTEEEVSAIKNYLLPKMLTAGFVTVTIASVVIAGFVAGMI